MFEVLEHTADIGFRATAKSLTELFEEAAAALVDIVLDAQHTVPRKSIAIAASGDSKDALLVNWLNEVLYYLDGERMAIAQCRVLELTDSRIAGEICGEPRDAVRHEPRMVVKGVTYHQLKLEQDENGWACEVYVDV